jgi:filamentous hemagglutinin
MTATELAERRKTAAGMANNVGTQAGRIAATATTAAAVPGLHTPVAEAVAVGATVVNFGATVTQQLLSPNAGALGADAIGTAVGEASNAIPGYGKLVGPVVNEITETGKSSSWATNVQNWINERLTK